MNRLSAWLRHMVVTMVFLTLVAMGTPATAGEVSDTVGPIDCEMCYEGMGAVYYHHGMNGGGAGSGTQVNVNCSVGDGCHDDSEPGACLGGSDEHERCEVSLDEDEASTMLRELTEAIDSRDIRGILYRVERANSSLHVNADRQAIQMIDCQGIVVAHLRVSDEVMYALMDNQ